MGPIVAAKTSKLERMLPGMYAELHAKGAFLGDSWKACVNRFYEFCPSWESLTTVDYGCGPRGGLQELTTAEIIGQVIPYDPFIEKYATPPWGRSFDLFFSCDVFEHMTLAALHTLMEQLRVRVDLHKIFVSVTTRPANKTLSNGLNAHLTIHPSEWWYGFLCGGLSRQYEPVIAECDLVKSEAIFGFQRKE